MEDDISPARIWGWVFAAIGCVLVLAVALWAFGVFTSGVKGKGDVIKKNNDSNNQIEAQHTFTALFGDIQSYKTKIASALKDTKAHPDQTFYAQVLTGLESTCSDAVQQYNADAISTTMKEWRPSDLPAQINPTDYCEVTP